MAETYEDAAERFVGFFAATIRNPKTRVAYMSAWLPRHLEPMA